MTPQEVADKVAANMMEALGLRLEQRKVRGFCSQEPELFEYGDDDQLLRIRYILGNLWSMGLILIKRQASSRYFSWYTGELNHEELLALRPPEDVKAIIELMKRGE